MPEIRFYCDEMIPSAITFGLRLRGVDVLTVQEAGRTGRTDEEQLAFATEQQRVMVTMDGDYLALHHDHQPHAGIAYSPQSLRTYREMIDGLLLIHGVLEPADMANRIEYI